MKIILGIALFIHLTPALALSAGDESEDFKPLEILLQHCAACHRAADHPGALFLSRSGLKQAEVIKLMIRTIETSQMPPAHKAFKTTQDGKKLLAWLKRNQFEK